MLSFVLHFAILVNSGPGDAQMSSLFQAGLYGNNFDDNPLRNKNETPCNVVLHGRFGVWVGSDV